MRRYALSGAIVLIFAAAAAMVLAGPLPIVGDFYARLQQLTDASLVAQLGRVGAGVLVMAAGLVLAMALRGKAPPVGGPAGEPGEAGEAPSPRITLVPRRKPDPQEAEADAEARASAERRMAALRERTSAPAETYAEPGPVLVLRRPRGAEPAAWQGARSWLGGLPRLGGQAWPMSRIDGAPLPFAAQIDLADLAAARPDSGLPDSGSLAFFLGDGAVIYVPAAPDGACHPRFPQAPASLAVRDGEEPFPPQPSPEASGTWPWWPVDLVALDLPPHLADHRNEKALAAIEMALLQAEHAIACHREGPLDAESLSRDCGIDPVPLWWHSVRHFTSGLRRARHHAHHYAQDRTGGDAEMLDTAIAALDWFAEGRADADPLSAAERADFETMFSEIHQHCGEDVVGFVPERMADLATASLRAMASDPASLHAALPPAMAERIDRDHRQPLGAAHRMFGLATCAGDTFWQHREDVLLLQLASDDLMEWHFGEGGVFQFWISPRDLAEGWLDRAQLTFDRP